MTADPPPAPQNTAALGTRVVPVVLVVVRTWPSSPHSCLSAAGSSRERWACGEGRVDVKALAAPSTWNDRQRSGFADMNL